MVAILFVLIQLVSLIAGCLLQEFEENGGEPAFESVLSAWYWIFCRLIAMKDTPFRDGKVNTDGGITVLAITLTLKGVLWIVPIARIKQIFQEEYNTVVKGSSLQHKVVNDLLGQIRDSDKDHLVSTTHGSTCALVEVACNKPGAHPECLPILFIHVPATARVADTSNISQNAIGSYSGPLTCRAILAVPLQSKQPLQSRSSWRLVASRPTFHCPSTTRRVAGLRSGKFTAYES